MTNGAPGSFPILELSVGPYDVHEMFRERLPPLKIGVQSYAFPMFAAVFGFALVDMTRAANDQQRLVTSMVETIGLTRDQVEALVDGIAPSVKELAQAAGMFKPRRAVQADVFPAIDP